jgi:hypothetical protein
MGLRDLFRRWTSRADADSVEREYETEFARPHERDALAEEFEARKDDIHAEELFPRGHDDAT